MVDYLMALIPDESFKGINPKTMVPELVEIIKGSSKFKVRLNLYRLNKPQSLFENIYISPRKLSIKLWGNFVNNRLFL